MAGPTDEEYNEFFDEADVDKSGALTLTELTEMLKKQGHREQQVKGFFRAVDTSGDGLISRQEFLEAMGCIPHQYQKGAAMRNIFRSFDRDGNGCIEKSELKEMFKEMGKHFSDKELERMVELMDADGSGSVDYEEFIEYYCNK